MSDITTGLLIIGVSNTVLFEADQTVELILLNLATGEDFTLPVSPEQAEHLFAHVGPQEGEEASDDEVEDADHGDQQGRLKDLLDDKTENSAQQSAWDDTEKASQL